MEALNKRYTQLIKHIPTKHVRNLYNEIDWNARLIGIKGARGVGKSTLLLQRILLAFPDRSKATYASLDDLWFANHTLLDLADQAVAAGVTHLFLDEVHRLRGWERQIKNIYDFYPTLNIVFTGSSLLEIDHSVADLSRRLLMYTLHGLSFREYLAFHGHLFDVAPLDLILYDHQAVAMRIADKIDVLPLFDKYLRHGYYPFHLAESESSYLTRVGNIISSVIDLDIPAVVNVEYDTLTKLKQLVGVIAMQSPSPLNAKLTAELLGVTNNHMLKLFSLLDRAQILRLLYFKSEHNPKSMVKPQKVLFDNSSLLYALGQANVGKVRETFFASMLAHGHVVSYPKDGDLLVDSRYLFEVGGARKSFQQIKDLPDSFIAAAELTHGLGNKIPLWLFGFLY